MKYDSEIFMLKWLPHTTMKISRPSLRGRQWMAAGCFSGYCFFALHHKSTQGAISFFWTIINANVFSKNYKSIVISYDDFFRAKILGLFEITYHNTGNYFFFKDKTINYCMLMFCQFTTKQCLMQLTPMAEMSEIADCQGK